MYATSGAFVEGYTVVVAPPAHMIARSTAIHSTLVPQAIATRCSGSSPSESSPAARSWTSSPASAQVQDFQPPSRGARNASRSGVAAIRVDSRAPRDGASSGSGSLPEVVRPAPSTRSAPAPAPPVVVMMCSLSPRRAGPASAGAC